MTLALQELAMWMERRDIIHKKKTNDPVLRVSDMVLRATEVQRRKTDGCAIRQLILRRLQELVRVRTEDFIAKRE